MMVEVPIRYTKKMMRHVSRFYGLRCAIDIVDRELFPNGKEITESMGAYFAVQNHLREYHPKDESVSLFAVGDGVTPRTAALFAFMTKWTCYSIDPLLREQDWNVDRLHVVRKHVEDVKFHGSKVIIACVHSHADMRATLKSITGEQRSMVSIPCCVSYNHIAADKEYFDEGIWSPKNFVKVWRDI